jgi:hypothetical protein
MKKFHMIATTVAASPEEEEYSYLLTFSYLLSLSEQRQAEELKRTTGNSS